MVSTDTSDDFMKNAKKCPVCKMEHRGNPAKCPHCEAKFKYELPPFGERSFIQHVGRLMEAFGAISFTCGILMLFGFIYAITGGSWPWRRLIAAVIMTAGGLPFVALGEHLYTPKDFKEKQQSGPPDRPE